jgi:NACHT domain
MTMTGLETIGFTAAAKGLTDLVIKPIGEVLNKRLDEPFKQLIFNAFGKYIQNYNDRHGILKVLGMPEPVKLEDIYTSVQFLGESRLWQFDPLRLEEAFRDTQERKLQPKWGQTRDGLKVANTRQYLMVLGQPGAGKSTFLRRIGLEALKGKKGHYDHECVPVFLELKRFTTGEVNIEKAIADEFDICKFPDPINTTQKLLDSGKLLILLDGLDEVPTQYIDSTITQIQDFSDKYKQNRFITSCRTSAYKSGFQKFVDVVIADFDDTQIRQFIHNWFQSEKDVQIGTAQTCWELLRQPVHAAIKELAQTPLLLTFLCLVFDDSQTFPEKRAELYKRALDVLLSKWAAEKRIQRDPIYKDLTLPLETMMLAEIAYCGFRADCLFFSRREVVEQIHIFLDSNSNAPHNLDGDVILNAIQIQQGVLVERANDVFSFSHLTLQEYLSAQYITDNDRADNNLIEKLVNNHLTEKRWREVFQLIGGLMRGGAEPLLLQIDRQTQKFIDNPKLQSLINWSNQETKNSDGNFNSVAKRAFLLFFAIVLARIRARDVNFNSIPVDKLNHTAQLSHDLFLELTLDHKPDTFRTLKNEATLGMAFGLPLDRALSIVIDHARDLNCALAYDIKNIKIFSRVNFLKLISNIESFETNHLENKLPYEIRSDIAEKVLLIWYDSIFLDPSWIDLSETEINNLTNYLYANELMVRCKKSALRVSPQVWTEIESRMLTVREQ